MSEKPILFNTEMVRAILDDRKTVTRRVVKDPYTIGDSTLCSIGLALHKGTNDTHGMPYPDAPYRPGDILYVREAWGDYREFFEDGEGPFYLYKADYPDGAKSVPLPEDQKTDYADAWDLPKWHPSIHMPKDAARIWLRVKDVRIEQLQTPFFAPVSPVFELLKEGIDIGDHCWSCIDHYAVPCCVDQYDGDECGMLDDPRGEFSDLWDKTVPRHPNKFKSYPYRWVDNPWVWVVEFERCEDPGKIKQPTLRDQGGPVIQKDHEDNMHCTKHSAGCQGGDEQWV